MNDKAEHYLGYMDKEMGIMGVLSTFSLAVPALFFERVVSADPKSIAHDFLATLWSSGSPYLIVASILMLSGAAFFYRQRSQLAWYYGQIALEITLPNYTERRLDQWLKDVDSWKTWIPYNRAFWILIFAAFEFVLAVSSAYVPLIQEYALPFALILVVLLILLLLWIRRNSIKFKDLEELPYFRIC